MTDSPHESGRHVTLVPWAQEPATFDACSLCLRVRHDSRWMEAETAIRAFRSFDHDELPRLRPAICDVCAGLIALRRSAPVAKAA